MKIFGHILDTLRRLDIKAELSIFPHPVMDNALQIRLVTWDGTADGWEIRRTTLQTINIADTPADEARIFFPLLAHIVRIHQAQMPGTSRGWEPEANYDPSGIGDPLLTYLRKLQAEGKMIGAPEEEQ